jgi:hypothetical protein
VARAKQVVPVDTTYRQLPATNLGLAMRRSFNSAVHHAEASSHQRVATTLVNSNSQRQQNANRPDVRERRVDSKRVNVEQAGGRCSIVTH